MAKKTRQEQGQGANEEVRTALPPGGKLLCTLEGHQDEVCSVAFDPQSGMLASGSFDNTVKLWDAQSGKLLRTLEGHTSLVGGVAFSSNGRLLASNWRCLGRGRGEKTSMPRRKLAWFCSALGMGECESHPLIGGCVPLDIVIESISGRAVERPN